MKKHYTSFFKAKLHTSKLVLIFAGLLTFNNLKAQVYCSAAALFTGDDEIFNVTFASMSNTTTCTSIGGPGSSVSLYNNYTTLVPAPVVSLGMNYPLSVTVGMCGTFGYSGIVRVWIDWNQDGDFFDTGEEVYTSPYTAFPVAGAVVSAAGGVTIPITALPGVTRMRVMESETSVAPTPCTNPFWGEVEDYNINILLPSPLDLGVSAIVKPTSLRECFGNDTIVARVTNYGSAIANFATNPTTVTVKTSGAVVGTYTVAVSSGTLGTFSSRDYTVTNTFNMNTVGLYNFKGYTRVIGDGAAINDTVVSSINKVPYFTTTISPNDSVCLGVPVLLNSNYKAIKKVGNGLLTNLAYTFPTPYGNFDWGSKHQFLILASELTAAGLNAGNFTTIGFNTTNLNASAALTNYNMSMASTTVTSITSFTTAGLTTYFSVASYTPVLGLNTHTLSSAFVWDGVSNIILETCFNNSSFSNNVSVQQSATPFISSVWYSADISGVCTTLSSTSLASQRPNIYFGQPAVVTYSWSPAIGLSSASVSNPTANLLASQNYTVSANKSGCTSYDLVNIHIKPTPTPSLGNDTSVCVLPLMLNASTSAASFLWSTGAITSTINVSTYGNYWVRGTNSNGCSNTDSVIVTVGVFPIVTLGSDTTFCSGKTVTLYAGNPGSTYLWSTGATTSTLSVGTPGTYSVIVTNTTSCQKSDVINVTSRPTPSVSLIFGGQTRFCPTETTRLLTEGTPSGGTYIGSGVSGTNFNPNAAGQGTYLIFYSYTAANGCSGLGKDTLIVNACVGVDEIESTLGLNVYPNPNSGLFTLEINASSDINAQISVMSIDGRLVYEDKAEGNIFVTKSIDISELSNGIYYLTVNTKDAKRTYKILKQ